MSGPWGWDDICELFSLVSDLHDVACDLGIHPSCAMQLAQALYGLGVEHASGVFEVDARELSRVPRIGPKAMQLARALRSWADQLSEREDEFGVVVRSLVADLREAADTIESMRDRLQAVGETCELTAFADVPFNVDYEIEGYDSSSGKDYATLCECSKCGAFVIIPPAYHHVLTCDGDEVYQPYRFCPSCRREVVDA